MGITGISCLKFFISRKIYPKIMDFNYKPQCIAHVLKFKDIIYHVGSINYQWIQESNLIITSPGIPLFHPALIYAREKRIKIIGDIEIFVKETNIPIIAITGSNGKSTVTIMVKNILKSAGIKVYIGGNIGIPALKILNYPAEIYILELSSFQLETTYSLKAKVAIILNISPDHMNRYPIGMMEYVKTKCKIYQHAKKYIINVEDEFLKNNNIDKKNCITLGIEKGEYHLTKILNDFWLCYKSKKLLNTKELLISGKHNYMNALSAFSIVHSLNVNIEIILKSLKKFCGLPHRLQLIYEKNNVKWINDSKSTNIGSTKSAIENFLPNIEGKIRLILGGDGKSANFSPLIPYLKNEKIKIYCYGKSEQELAKLCPKKSICLKTLKNVIISIKKIVKSGDVVLLSPSCSSLDQFSSFEERGNMFTKFVKELYK